MTTMELEELAIAIEAFTSSVQCISMQSVPLPHVPRTGADIPQEENLAIAAEIRMSSMQFQATHTPA